MNAAKLKAALWLVWGWGVVVGAGFTVAVFLWWPGLSE